MISGTGPLPFTNPKEGFVANKKFIAKVKLKGSPFTVHYEIIEAMGHQKRRGDCSECKHTKDEVSVMNISIKKVLNGAGRELSQKDHLAKSAGAKVLGTLRHAKRVCAACVTNLLDEGRKADRLGQTFVA